MSDEPQLITQSTNEFLRQTFRSFLAETQEPSLATAMTACHVQHQQNILLEKQVKTLVQIHWALRQIVALTDPVVLGDLLSMLRAMDGKREESKASRAKAEADQRFNKILNATDEELAS